MSRPPNPLESPNAAPEPASAHQETVLLSEAPDPVAPVEQAPPAASPPVRSAPDPSTAGFSISPNLAPLTQRYDILGEAGHGNMGNVYKARDRETGEIVALKLVKPEIASDAAMMERFKNELLFARKITHKNVCRVYDFNRIGGIAYTSMEFVEGESLRSVLNRFGGFPIRKGLNVALQICSGLKEAHAQGIVHRDLKPENVMIDAQGNVKIMDFGIARSMEAATRLTGSMVGTPAYMAPEQVSGKPVDYRTDVYSLGLMLYEMFTGMQAVQADTPVAVALKQIRETPPPPHDVEPTIPLTIERAILKCLEKDPARRFQSVAELEKALSAPGMTGSSPGPGPCLTAAPRPEAVKARLGSPALAAPKTRNTPPVVWAVVLLTLLFSGMAAAHWTQVVKTANHLPAPAAPPAPEPPDFALTIPLAGPSATPPETPAETPAPPATKPKSATNKPPRRKPESGAESTALPSSPREAKNTVKPPDQEVFPPRVLPGHNSARQIELEKPPGRETPAQPGNVAQDVEQRANKAFGATKSSVSNEKRVLLWVGRYTKEDKAQEVVNKIRGLGLPALSFPRHGVGGGEFWIVVTGPIESKSVADVTQWLEAQGYRNVHPLEAQAGTQPGKPKPNPPTE